ncbi:MAG: hypothetical protein AB1453_12870, partial [Chloroflexota bacterium]
FHLLRWGFIPRRTPPHHPASPPGLPRTEAGIHPPPDHPASPSARQGFHALRRGFIPRRTPPRQPVRAFTH